MRRPLIDRFLDKVSPEPMSGCWLWTGAAVVGYGVIKAGGKYGKSLYAHRVSYEHYVGPIAPGLVIDHLCRVPLCVNPKHLESVTERVNILRGTGYTARAARKTHCPYGHPYDDVNTGRVKAGRYCKACNRARVTRYYKSGYYNKPKHSSSAS